MNSTPNIVNILPNYNPASLDINIENLKRELIDQNEVNKLLKGKNIEENTINIQNFIERNEGEIDNQLEKLETVINDLKNVVLENMKLEENEILFNELIKSEASKRVAQKLLKIKAMKNDINFFLAEKGIIIASQ